MPSQKIIQFRRKTKNINNQNFNGKKFSHFEKIGYLTNPNISLGYMCKNVIKNRGYDIVKKSFESIKGQSKDIMIVDNDSDDADQLQELSKRFGFRYFNVSSNPKYNWDFDLAKVCNKIIYEAKYNIVVRLSPEIIYPYCFSWYVLSFFQQHDPRKWFLGFRLLNYHEDGTVQYTFGEEWTIFKPFFMECRGWDERTTYFVLEDLYSFAIMSYVYNCKQHIPNYFYLKHCHHPRAQGNRDSRKKVDKNIRGWDWEKQLDLLKTNPKKYRKRVVNSLW